jgi:hypothetical protein
VGYHTICGSGEESTTPYIRCQIVFYIPPVSFETSRRNSNVVRDLLEICGSTESGLAWAVGEEASESDVVAEGNGSDL